MEYEALLAAEALPAGVAPRGRARVAAKLGRHRPGCRLRRSAPRAAGRRGRGGAASSELDATLGLDGTLRLVRRGPDDEDASAPPLELESDQRATFGDVGGLEDVKKTIHRTIILPYQRPELYETYGAASRRRDPALRPAGLRQDAARARHRRRVRPALLERPDRGDPRPVLRGLRAQPARRVRAGAPVRAVRALPRRARRDRVRAAEAHRQRRPAARRPGAAGARRDRRGQRGDPRPRRHERALGPRRGAQAPGPLRPAGLRAAARRARRASRSSTIHLARPPARRRRRAAASRGRRRSSAAPTSARSSSAPSTS